MARYFIEKVVTTWDVGPRVSPLGSAIFFLSEPVAFRRVYGLESYSRTRGIEPPPEVCQHHKSDAPTNFTTRTTSTSQICHYRQDLKGGDPQLAFWKKDCSQPPGMADNTKGSEDNNSKKRLGPVKVRSQCSK